jgi:hypothetical protein
LAARTASTATWVLGMGAGIAPGVASVVAV